MSKTLLDQIKQANPIITNVANSVTVDQVANVQNIIGASPIMSSDPEEAPEMVAIAQALSINIGTLSAEPIHQMKTLMAEAYRQAKPVVIDPVAVGSIHYRQKIIDELLALGTPQIIRGNAGEIAYLAGLDWQANGIDAGNGEIDLVKVARTAAKKQQTTILLSGPTDIITDGHHTTKVANGTPLFQVHVGSGDMLTGLCAAFVAVSPDNPYQAAIDAATTFAVAGQLVAEAMTTPLPGSFYPQLLDCLFNITAADVQTHAQVTEVLTHE